MGKDHNMFTQVGKDHNMFTHTYALWATCLGSRRRLQRTATTTAAYDNTTTVGCVYNVFNLLTVKKPFANFCARLFAFLMAGPILGRKPAAFIGDL
jgi:hypothetical protein